VADFTNGGPTFEPGWPAIFPSGLVVVRSQVFLKSSDDEEEYDEPEIEFVLHGSASDTSPKFAITGELTVQDSAAFAGVLALMPIYQREEPENFGTDDARDLLLQYGNWASGILYDFAAAALRAQLAAAGVQYEIPFETVTPQIALDAE